LTRFDSVLLGDNPFFGVDHLSQERARSKASESQNIDNIAEVIKYSFNLGIKGMVVSTHPALKTLIDKLRSERSEILEKFEFYPILPYVQGYVTKINEKGMINTIIETLSSGSFKNKMKIVTKGGIGVIRKDIFELFKVFIDIELLQLKNTKINTVFLHDVITDLALSLNMKKIFEVFQEYLHENYKVNAGLVTKNFPRLITKLSEWGLEYSTVMTSFNKIGFQMNPSREECEKSLDIFKGQVIAMSILAGGYLELNDAYQYILTQQKIKKIVVGVSSIEHARKTFGLLLNKDI
jgi:hypothetical protein